MHIYGLGFNAIFNIYGNIVAVSFTVGEDPECLDSYIFLMLNAKRGIIWFQFVSLLFEPTGDLSYDLLFMRRTLFPLGHCNGPLYTEMGV